MGGMVLIGGMTRITRSGLSMVDWKPQGRFPPWTVDEWNQEFEKYKTFPEYQQRQNMVIRSYQEAFFLMMLFCRS